MKQCEWEIIVRTHSPFIPLASLLFNLNFNLLFSLNQNGLPQAVYLDSIVLGAPFTSSHQTPKNCLHWVFSLQGLFRVPDVAINSVKDIIINFTPMYQGPFGRWKHFRCHNLNFTTVFPEFTLTTNPADLPMFPFPIIRVTVQLATSVNH